MSDADKIHELVAEINKGTAAAGRETTVVQEPTETPKKD